MFRLYVVLMLILMFAEESNAFIEWISYPPGSMLFVLLLSSIVAVTSTLLTKLLVDTDELQRKQLLIKEHQEEKKQIIKLAETDPNRYRKKRKQWEKKDAFLKKTQQGMAFARLKPTCITFLPMLIIFGFLRGLFATNPVAAPPMNAYDVPLINTFIIATTEGEAYDWTKLVYGEKMPIEARHGWINFTAWYFLCSLGINTLLQRLLKIQTQASGGMEQMFKGQQAQGSEFPDI